MCRHIVIKYKHHRIAYFMSNTSHIGTYIHVMSHQDPRYIPRILMAFDIVRRTISNAMPETVQCTVYVVLG